VLYNFVFSDVRKEFVAIAFADGKVIAGNADRPLVDIVNLAGLYDIGAVNAHEARLGETVLDVLHRHKCHNGTYPLDVQTHIVLYTLHKLEFVEVYPNQTVLALDEEEAFLKDTLLLRDNFCFWLIIHIEELL